MRHRITVFIILLLGFSLRLYFILASPYSKSSVHTCDISTIGLMAKHILEGEFPLFFYGQYYLGPLEAVITSPFFILFGIKMQTVYLGVLSLSILFMISTYYLGKILVDRRTGLISLLYVAFPPSYFFGESVTPAGYHIEIPFLGNLLFIVTLLICKGRRYIYYIILGILAGIGFWTHYIILYYLLAVGIYLLLHERIRILFKNGILAVISGIAVSLPFWLFTIQNDLCTFKFPPGSSEGGLERYYIVLKAFLDKFTCILGLGSWHTSRLQLIIIVFYIIMIVYYILKERRSLLSHFFLSALGIYVFYSSNMYAGGAWWYLTPLISFIPVCFAYFYNRLSRWNKAIGLSFVIFIISFNLWDILGLIGRDTAESRQKQKEYFSRIEFLEKNNLYRIIGDDRELRNVEFLSVEKIIGTGIIDGDYFPHEDEVSASSRVAFEASGVDFIPSLNNICKGYRYEEGLYFDFEPFPYVVRSIPLRSSNPSFVDLGKIYKICRILIFDAQDLKVEVSVDGYNWVEVASVESPTTLFWSGPRVYWHPVYGRIECFFKPTKARFVRAACAGDILIYEYLGDRPFYHKDYVKEIKRIFRFLKKEGISFVYADYWPSAQIRKLSKGGIEALVPHNTWKPFRKNMERNVILNKDRAIIIAREDAEELEVLLNEFNIGFKKKIFDRYACYYFPYLKEDISYFAWTGVGLAK